MYCAYCDSEIDGTEKVCPHCGAPKKKYLETYTNINGEEREICSESEDCEEDQTHGVLKVIIAVGVIFAFFLIYKLIKYLASVMTLDIFIYAALETCIVLILVGFSKMLMNR